MAALTILASFTEQQKPPTVNKQRILISTSEPFPIEFQHPGEKFS